MTNIELLDKSIQKNEIKIKKEKPTWRKKVAIWKEKELKLLPKKIILYKQILGWRDEFVKTKQFKKIIKKLNDCIIFRSGYAHEMSNFDSGVCWSKLYLEESGELRYWAGYKWMPTGPKIILTNNPKNAEKFSYRYLKELHNSITTGKIYKTIAKELKDAY